MAIEALNSLLHDHCAPIMQFGDIKYLVLSSLHIINNNNNHENVKYAATNIVNKMTIVEDLNGFGTKSFKTLFIYVRVSSYVLWNVINLLYHETYHWKK